MALSHVVSEIFNVEKYRDLEIPVRGQSRSSKMVPFGFLLAFYSNFVPIRRTVFEIFDFKSSVTLKTGLRVGQGH